MSPSPDKRFLSHGLLLACMVGSLMYLASNAAAVPRLVKYVQVTVPQGSLDLGSTARIGENDCTGELKVHVSANCAHTGLIISATPLKNPAGETIPPERLLVRRPVTGEYVPFTHAVSVTGPMNPGVVDVVLKFRLITTLAESAGVYSGTLTVTCAELP